MVTHSNILAWEIPWTEEPGWLQSKGHKELDTAESTEHTHKSMRSSASLWFYSAFT